MNGDNSKGTLRMAPVQSVSSAASPNNEYDAGQSQVFLAALDQAGATTSGTSTANNGSSTASSGSKVAAAPALLGAAVTGLTSANYQSQLNSEFGKIYGSNPVTLGTVLTSTPQNWTTLENWINDQGSGFKNWFQSSSSWGSTSDITSAINGGLANVYSKAGDVATALTGLINDMHNLASTPLNTTNPSDYINQANGIISAASADFQTVLGPNGPLANLQTAIAQAEGSNGGAQSSGYSSYMVSIAVLNGLGETTDALNVTAANGMTTAATDLGNLFSSTASGVETPTSDLSTIITNYANQLPSVVNTYNTNNLITGLTTALDLASAFVGFGTGLTKLGLAGGLDAAASGDAKAGAEFGSLVNSTLSTLKNATNDGKTLAGLTLPSSDSAIPGSPDTTFDSALQNWVQAIATNWPSYDFGGTQINTLPSNLPTGSGGQIVDGAVVTNASGDGPPPAVNPGYAPGQSGGTQYSMFYWVQSTGYHGSGQHGIPEDPYNIWTLYGIPETNTSS
jgi:hypothetical protein